MTFLDYLSNAHTHSHLSDGHNTLEDMVKKAFDCGYISIGITDHSPVFFFFFFEIKSIDEYVEKVCQIKKHYEGQLEIICGLEYDFDTNLILPKEIAYTIGSVHTIKTPSNNLFKIENGCENFIKGVNFFYNGSFINAAKDFFEQTLESSLRPNVDIVGHFDLISKYNSSVKTIFDDHEKKYLEYAFDAVDSILSKRPEMIFEINTGCIPRAKRLMHYPSIPILKRIREKKGRIILNSDAHLTKDLNAGFDFALKNLSDIGFKKIVRVRNFGFEELKIK